MHSTIVSNPTYSGYFYLQIDSDKLYKIVKTPVGGHNYPDHYKFDPVTGEVLWNIIKTPIEIYNDMRQVIIDPRTGKTLVQVLNFMGIDSSSGMYIGFKINKGDRFIIPIEIIKTLELLLKEYNVISPDMNDILSRFMFTFIDDTYGYLADILKIRKSNT